MRFALTIAKALVIAIVVVAVSAGTAHGVQAQQCMATLKCSGERVCLSGRCTHLAEAAAPGGRVFWVDQHDLRADDRNSGDRENPWTTIGRAARRGAMRPGDVVVVRGGVYRETVEPQEGGSAPDRRIAYIAYPGEDVIVTGADPANDGWTRHSGLWKRSYTQSLRAYGDEEFRRELIVVDGQVLEPVYDREAVREGTFFVEGSDENPQALYMLPHGDLSLTGRKIEIGRRHPLFSPAGGKCGSPEQVGYLHVVGFTFRHAVNRAQWGAVCAGGEGSLFEENTIEWTNGLGIDISGRQHTFRANQVVHNGQMGFGGSCDGCLLTGNVSSYNNWKHHNAFWEAGGGKFVRTKNTVIRHHTAENNEGPGIWFDIENEDNTIEYSRIAGNWVAGILLELATVGTLVRRNLIVDTRFHGWSGSGLLAQAASHNVIVHNTFAHNDGSGVWIRLDPDRRATDGYNLIYNNLFVENARSYDGEGREISIRGYDIDHARTNRLDGNAYWPHESSMSRSTFYFQPDPQRQANFRSDDIAQWRVLTGSDTHSVVLRGDASVTQKLAVSPAADLPIGTEELGIAVERSDVLKFGRSDAREFGHHQIPHHSDEDDR